MKSPLIFLFSGLDPSGSAGLLIDVKVTREYQIPSIAVPASLTIQSYDNFIKSVETPSDYFQKLLTFLSKTLLSQFTPFAKVGMISGKANGDLLTRWIKQRDVPAVTDIVLRPTFSKNFVAEDIETIVKIATVSKIVTISFEEGAFMLKKVAGLEAGEPEALGEQLLKTLGCEFLLVKTGDMHKPGDLVKDYLISRKDMHIIKYRKIPKTVRGTGCILSSSITCELASKRGVHEAVKRAYRFTRKAVKEAIEVKPALWTWL